jgi:hypothetical protein
LAFTFATLQTEFYARGFDYLNADTAGQTRAKRWLNEAQMEVCETGPYPFLEATTTGTGTITFTDLREIIAVLTTVNPALLTGVDRHLLLQIAPDLSLTGAPVYWYLENEVLKVFPVASTTGLTCRYLKVPAEMTLDADTLTVPNQYANLVLDAAAIRAYRDSDDFDAADRLRIHWNESVQRMQANLLNRNRSNPGYIIARRDRLTARPGPS